jgi:hypothetical protein
MPKRRKIQIKKAACLSDRLHFLAITTNFYSKLPLARRILSHRPPPVTGIFAVNLPHNIYIKPSFVLSVK